MTHNHGKLVTVAALAAMTAVAGGVRSHQHDQTYANAVGDEIAYGIIETLYFVVAWPTYLFVMIFGNIGMVQLDGHHPHLIPIFFAIQAAGDYLLLRKGWQWRKKYRRFMKGARFHDKTIQDAVTWARQHDTSWDNARPYRAYCEICDKSLGGRSAVTIAQADLWLHYHEEHPDQLPVDSAAHPQLPTFQPSV